MKEKKLQPRYKLTDRTVVLAIEIAEALANAAGGEPERVENPAAIRAFLQMGGYLEEEQAQEITKALQQNVKRLLARRGQFLPYRIDDLKLAHRILWKGILVSAGEFRGENVLWNDGKKFSYAAPAAKRIPGTVEALLIWVQEGKKTPPHPLIQTAVAGYALEALQPFADGNRLLSLFWQLLILSTWKPEFPLTGYLSALQKHRAEYEQILREAVLEEKASDFVEFVLNCCLEAVQGRKVERKKKPGSGPNDLPEPLQQLLSVLGEETLSARELMEGLNLKHRPSFRTHYLLPALNRGLIEMTIPEKPNSCHQQYKASAAAAGTPGEKSAVSGPDA